MELSKNKKITTIGGQALIEGLMMIGPKQSAVAVRKPDGEIIVEKKKLPKRGKLTKVPFVRGGILLFTQMVIGIKALMFSADQVDLEDEEEEPSKFEKFLLRIFKDKFKDVLIYTSVIISLAFSVGLFMVLPNVAARFAIDLTTSYVSDFTFEALVENLFEGLIRVTIFFVYLLLASRLKDIKRVWQYHGAEHKTIHCYEAGEELTVENIRKHSTKHPRCGTSFLFTVMIISILIFTLTGKQEIWVGILLRIVLIPVVAGVSYEIFKIIGKTENKLTRFLRVPGLLFQKFTTDEPDDSQLEVAVEAMKGVMAEEEGLDEW